VLIRLESRHNGANEHGICKVKIMVIWRSRSIWRGRFKCAESQTRVIPFARRASAAGALILGISAITANAPSRLWLSELVSNLAVPLGLFGLAVTIAAIVCRARPAGLIAIGASAGLLWPMGAGFAPRRLIPFNSEAPSLSIVVANVYALNPQPDRLLELLAAQSADVVVLTEPPPPIMRALSGNHTALTESATLLRSPPRRGEHAWLVVLSRFPAELVEDPSDGVLACDLETPLGPIRFVACHVISPRSLGRYKRASAQLERVAALAQADGRAVVIAGDFNAVPTARSQQRLALRTNTRRAAPLWRAGTFPARWPSLLRLHLDGALVSESLGVVGWESIELPGSDHLGVRIVLQKRTSP